MHGRPTGDDHGATGCCYGLRHSGPLRTLSRVLFALYKGGPFTRAVGARGHVRYHVVSCRRERALHVPVAHWGAAPREQVQRHVCRSERHVRVGIQARDGTRGSQQVAAEVHVPPLHLRPHLLLTLCTGGNRQQRWFNYCLG